MKYGRVTRYLSLYLYLSICMPVYPSAYLTEQKKNSGPYGIWTHDLCDTGAALYQLS